MNTSSSNKNIVFHPLISCIQKVALYETKTKLYLVGSNNRETRFRLLTIDRTVQDELKIHEDPNEIEAKDIRRFICSLGASVKSISAYGILGFVKFLEGYYLILVTKRTRCAFIGRHIIYTIKDTVMVRINEMPSKNPHPFEQRYVKMFCNIDLRSNFYFSYSYDLTRTLQYNLSAPRFVGDDDADGGVNIETDEPLPDWSKLTYNLQNANERIDYAYRGISRRRFVWNEFLLKPIQARIMLKDWLLEIIHGFISQSNISIYGRFVYVCLVARRSTRFAGTRFLKRGANFMGDVANEVETEQIVMDGTRLCSFVQMRGSIPSHWSQDVSKMVPKPRISLDLSDPFAQTSSKHFERLLFHYGSPIIILNLVKRGEKRKHESILSKEIRRSVRYLNQFLAPKFRMQYIHFDMARESRGEGNDVMESLAEIAERCVQQTGMFFVDSDANGNGDGGGGGDVDGSNEKSLQTGIVRVNCVDCLDRTNTAQFAIGKCVLAHQLHRFGLIGDPPKLEFDSDCVTMLENLYEDHGDTLALQYGGSQLVHRIKTYRKTAAWASQGNDIMQTLSRYLSNTFSDTEKQHSINLFLGYYIPCKNDLKQNPAIWELQTDYYMHNYMPVIKSNSTNTPPLLTDWVKPIIRKTLPYSCADANKIVKELFRVHSKCMELIDSYSNYHMSFKLTSFEEHIAYKVSQMARTFMPTFRTNFSPFQPSGRRREERASTKNPSLTGQSSTGSAASSNSSSEEGENSSSDEEEIQEIKGNHEPKRNVEQQAPLFPSMRDVYGYDVRQPNERDMALYKRYVQIGKLSSSSITGSGNQNLNRSAAATFGTSSMMTTTKTKRRAIKLSPLSENYVDTYECVQVPKVSEESLNIYKAYVNSPQTIIGIPSVKDLDVIIKYLEIS